MCISQAANFLRHTTNFKFRHILPVVMLNYLLPLSVVSSLGGLFLSRQPCYAYAYFLCVHS